MSYRDMVARIVQKVEEGREVKDLKPSDILDIHPAKLAKLIAADVAATRRTDGVNIRFAYVETREHYMKRAAPNDQWCDEHSDWVILSLAGLAYCDRSSDEKKEESYAARMALHHKWNAAFATHEKLALVTVNSGSDHPDPEWFSGGREDVIEVIQPKSWSEETAILSNGTEYCIANGEWLDAIEGSTTLTIDGVDLARSYISNGVMFVKLLAAPASLFESTGMLINAGVESASDWCNMISQFAANPGALVEVVADDDPTEEDKEAYEAAKLMLSLTVGAIKDNSGRIETLRDRADRHKRNIRDYMNQLIEIERTRILESKELATLESSDSNQVAEATGTMLSEYEKIVADAPVKRARLFERDGDSIMEIELHPLIVDCGEEGDAKRYEDAGHAYPAARGLPHFRLLDSLKMEMNISTGDTNVDRILKWIHPKNVKDGFDTRCHPHTYDNGTACWGELSAPFAEAVARREWHTALNWVYAYCAGVRSDEPHHTKHWMFKPAPEGASLGWVLPDSDEAKMLEGYDPEPTYDLATA